MKKKILGILFCGILLIELTGCKTDNNQSFKNNETFMNGTTLVDGRHISFTFDVPYNDGYLSEALLYNRITIDEFINKLDFESDVNDGGSKLYKYNKVNKLFGNKDFYVIVCNSTDGIKDIFVAKNINSLNDKCTIKTNDLEGITMNIKEGTLTNVGATVVIIDKSSRNNMYGESYRIDQFVDNEWKELDVVVEGNYGFNSIGYTVDEDNKLELDINWEWLYGKLKTGKYRIVKDTSYAGEGTTHYITAEFEIK